MKARHILVVGAGIFGVSAALELRRRGHSVTLVDPGPLPHPEASSTDVSKIVRADYGGDSFYARFVLDCIPEWHRWNSQARRTLYHETGFLLLAGERMRSGGFEHDSREVMKSLQIDVERMDGERLRSRFPAWTSDRYPDGYFQSTRGMGGTELFYVNSANELVAVQVSTDPAFAVGQQEVLFSVAAYMRNPAYALYDVTPDDQRFVMLRIGDTENAAASELILVENWSEELRER